MKSKTVYLPRLFPVPLLRLFPLMLPCQNSVQNGKPGVHFWPSTSLEEWVVKDIQLLLSIRFINFVRKFLKKKFTISNMRLIVIRRLAIFTYLSLSWVNRSLVSNLHLSIHISNNVPLTGVFLLAAKYLPAAACGNCR